MPICIDHGSSHPPAASVRKMPVFLSPCSPRFLSSGFLSLPSSFYRLLSYLLLVLLVVCLVSVYICLSVNFFTFWISIIKSNSGIWNQCHSTVQQWWSVISIRLLINWATFWSKCWVLRSKNGLESNHNTFKWRHHLFIILQCNVSVNRQSDFIEESFATLCVLSTIGLGHEFIFKWCAQLLI